MNRHNVETFQAQARSKGATSGFNKMPTTRYVEAALFKRG